MVEGLGGFDLLLTEAGRLWRRISVERRTFYLASTRPESRADDLVRIGFSCDRIGARALWSAPPGETCYTKIEASPEKMDWTIFADKACAKLQEDAVA